MVVAISGEAALACCRLKQSLGQCDAGRNLPLEHLLDGNVAIALDILLIETALGRGLIANDERQQEHEKELLHRLSHSLIHSVLTASLAMRQSPRGDRLTLPTLGPSGRQERLNCWLKNRRQKV